MNNEFKKTSQGEVTRYVLESASGGGTSAGGVASVSMPIGGTRKRGDNLIAQEEQKEAPKPRNFVAKNAKMGGAGAHKDKKKAEKQGDTKHKNKSFDMAEGMDSLTFWKREAQKAGGADNIDWYSIGADHGRQGITMNPPYGVGAKAVTLYGKGLDAGKQGVAEGDSGAKYKVKSIGHDSNGDYYISPSTGKKVYKQANKGDHENPKTGEIKKKIAEDHEIQMASSELQSIAKDAVNLLSLVRRYSEKDGLDAWQQSKITKAADYLNAVLQSVSGQQGVAEAPIEMDPAEPMNPMIHGHQGANPAKLQYRMMRAAAQLKDLAQRAEQGSAIGWETIARQFDELAMNVEQIKHALEELAAKRKKGGIGSRGIDPNIGEDHSTVTGGRGQGGYDTYSNTRHGRGVAEVSDATKDSYKEKATQQVKDLKPHAKKGEYKDIAKNMIARREKGLARVSEDEYMMELAGKLAEKIPANAPTDVWVKDFQKANPNKYHQFKNKTPAKKAQMAVAASYAAKNPSKKK